MTNPPTFLVHQEAGPMLFADCPFCLAPLPLDLVTGTMDCQDCGVHLELAAEPVALPLAVPTAARPPLAPAA